MATNRYGPPPEFPLASTSSGIVHHLSGPDTHALSLDPSDKRIESAGDAPTAGAAGSHLRRTTPAFAFTTPCGFRTAPRLAHMLDSLVRVSRRVGKVADISRGPRAPRATTPHRNRAPTAGH
ncbi:unnamed protein product [Clavelina lepadiformis]|uniref:Uncharacterized protein n=1 Tax=Clavelina lepadiformis TaxID=159417 RepID=A0ABP0H3Z4_CLALP